jgi:D-alanyl-lipoteichoic acid acyltransferase DltB (MBOAT superfamily)
VRFNSFVYWIFLLGVVAILWLLPQKARKWWLLVTSYFFYGSWHWPYLALLVSSAALTHVGAKWMVAGDRRRRSRWLIAGNLLLLAAFKYLDWILGDANTLFSWLGWKVRLPIPGWVLPLGISFYLFELLSYIVDLARKRERIHAFWDFQLYVAFFPHLVAGPILRAKEFLPQLERKWSLRSEDVHEGLRLILSGLFVKIVLCDGLAPDIDQAFKRSPSSLGSLDVWLIAIGFGLQIYFDFAAYSRIALGSARLCGLSLVENFRWPYVARSPADFWQRWHISLSRWIRDYLFFPLAGRSGKLRSLCYAALVSMTLCGLWHGPRWTFVLWGLYHGLLVGGYHVVTRGRRPGPDDKPGRLRTAFGIALTFALVQLGWIFFRAQTVKQAAALFLRALTPLSHRTRALSGTLYLHVALLVLAIFLAPAVARACRRLIDVQRGRTPDLILRFAGEGFVMGILVALCLIYLHGQSAFIYFRF